jgi:hypothetical protein
MNISARSRSRWRSDGAPSLARRKRGAPLFRLQIRGTVRKRFKRSYRGIKIFWGPYPTLTVFRCSPVSLLSPMRCLVGCGLPSSPYLFECNSFSPLILSCAGLANQCLLPSPVFKSGTSDNYPNYRIGTWREQSLFPMPRLGLTGKRLPTPSSNSRHYSEQFTKNSRPTIGVFNINTGKI